MSNPLNKLTKQINELVKDEVNAVLLYLIISSEGGVTIQHLAGALEQPLVQTNKRVRRLASFLRFKQSLGREVLFLKPDYLPLIDVLFTLYKIE